jgi:hypothetical protein
LKQPNPELFWNRNAILSDLDENHVTVEEDVEMMWYKWEKVHIDLPAVWNFEWFKFDYFVSYDCVTKKDFEKEPELENKSYSTNDVWNLLKAMNKYMAELGCKTDYWQMDYENVLKYWEKYNTWCCKAWDCLQRITWLKRTCWLSDKNMAWRKGSRAVWAFHGDFCCFFDRINDEYKAYLFLRLSD